MKDKLYKLNKNSHRHIFKKIGIGVICAFAFAIILAIPLSISLTNQENIKNNIQLKAEIPFTTSDALKLNK